MINLVKVKKLFDGRLMFQPDIRAAHKAVNAALAEPPRQCDVGTAEEQYERLHRFCINHECRSCPCRTDKDNGACSIAWTQMPYEKGGAK